jgi:D-3-phosphoglycerate dehydrogenase
MTKKIIITDAVDKKAAHILENAGFEVLYKPGMKKEEIFEVIGDYNALIVRSETKATAEMIALMNKMEVIGRAGAGTDNIDREAATRKGILVMNTPGGNTISTAEHAFSLMLSMCRNIPQADASIKAGKWDKKSYKGTEVYGKVLGVFGLGKIGREVAIRAKGFGMQVIGYDPVLSNEVAAKLGIALTDIETIFKQADIITVHVPLDDNTRNLIRKETLALCKDGVKIVNCARGGIVNEDDIVEALNSGKVSAAAFDVYTKEPPDFSHPLFSHPKVVTTPHLGASTEEAQEKVAIQIAEQIVEYFTKNEIKGAVNAASLASVSKPELTPYVLLAEKLGSLFAQLIKGKVNKISVRLAGDTLSVSNGLISTAVIKGFLSKFSSDQVNLINSPFLAKEFGLKVEETLAGTDPDYANLLTVECVSDAETRVISGTAFGNNELRLVRLDNFKIEINPEGWLLFYSNIDIPGRLASVGKVLAEANINIAGLSLGRVGIGRDALTVISVDNFIEKETLAKIAGIDGVSSALVVKV